MLSKDQDGLQLFLARLMARSALSEAEQHAILEIPTQPMKVQSGRPHSTRVGLSGRKPDRSGEVTAITFTLPPGSSGIAVAVLPQASFRCPPVRSPR